MNLFTNGMEVFGDFGIFQMPFQNNEMTSDLSNLFDSGNVQVDETNYLQKGEKILTLLRKKKSKPLFYKDDVLEKVKKRWDLTLAAVARSAGDAMESQFLEILNRDQKYEEKLEDACSWLNEQMPKHLFVFPEYRDREIKTIRGLCGYKQSGIICMKYLDQEMILPVGAKFKPRFEGAAKIRGDKGPFLNVQNFSKTVSTFYLKKYVLEKFSSLRSQYKTLEEYMDLCVVGKILQDYGIKEGDTKFQKLLEVRRSFKGKIGLLVLYPETTEAEESTLMMEHYSLQRILEFLQEDYHRRKNEAKMEKNLSGDYALSFQTKKNIPQKCIKAMERSGFNNYFGYVEFDEECDLSLMEELYREYDAFARELSIRKFPEVSLRFRKLGNHKASGLYYYILKCLCVDVRTPGAFVHEVGHAIDYHLDHISDKYVFHEIAERYEYLLKEYMRNGNKDQVAVLKGKTKYNLEYYLMPTEIFARCFELYVVKVREVNNSLCEPNFGFAYPNDDILLDLIKRFYDDILGYEEKTENNIE